MSTNRHKWKFARVGGVDQVVIRDGMDIVNLPDLDQKLWVALACPVRGLELDQKSLEAIDTDKDGRIRVPEVLAAVSWLKGVLKDPNDLLKGGDSVALSAISDKTTEGAALLAGARRILQNLGKGDATSLALADLADTVKIFAATRFNGDGIVAPEAAEDEATQKAIADVIETHGSVLDRSGKPGVDQPRIDAFFAEATALTEWSDGGRADAATLPLGEGTAAAAAAVAALGVKIDDYFTRCRLAAFDTRAAAALNRAETEFQALAAKELTRGNAEIAALPLAHVEAGRPLPLVGGVNPAWAEALSELNRAALTPLLGPGRTSLSEAEWATVQGKLGAYREWFARKPATAVEKLGLPRLHEIIAAGAKGAITALLDQDRALEAENAQIAAVEKLLLWQRDLVKLLNNFVNFSDFYGRRGAVFQVGTLYLDGRACTLCVRVDDTGKHVALAGLSKTYLAYCECVRTGAEKITIAAAFTGGDSDNLMVGRNGIFYDRDGKDWDATITKVVENPISIGQAFWAPYKNFVRMIEEQVAKRAAAADAEANTRLQTAATASAHADKTQADKAQAKDKKIDVGTVAAIGVAVGGLATFLASILATFFGLGRWMPFGFVALVLAISGPAMLIAWLKLRQRNLGPILDANGWAINGRVRINVPFGRALTTLAALPAGAERTLKDPFAEPRRPWGTYVFLAVLVMLGISWYLGHIDAYLPPHVRSTEVLGASAPAASPAPTR